MFKKLLVAGIVLLAGLFVLKSTGFGGIAQLAWKEAREGLERAVPPEVQLKQLQVEIDKVDQDIRKNLGALATQEVDYQALADNVAGLKDLMGKLKTDIGSLTRKVEDRPAGLATRRDGFTAKLDALLATFENKKIELSGKEQLVSAKKQALEAAHERIGAMRDQKEKLRVTAAKLETRLEIVRLKEVQNKVEVDDSQVNRCNSLANKIENRLREKEKVAELNLQYGYRSEAPALDKPSRPTDEVLKAARRVLSEDSDDAARIEK